MKPEIWHQNFKPEIWHQKLTPILTTNIDPKFDTNNPKFDTNNPKFGRKFSNKISPQFNP